MPAQFEWVIDADALTPAQLSDLLSELTGLLGEIDSELSPSGGRTFNLRITSLSYSSPARIGVVALPRPNQRDQTVEAVRECASGLVLVERQGVRPPAFNDDALEHLRRVGNKTGNGLRSVEMRSEFTPSDAIVTRQASAHIERILPHGYSLGSVEGQLDGLNIHGQNFQFVLYDAVSGRAVRCYFNRDDLENVKAAIGRKIIVSGQLRRDPAGRPQQVRPVEFFGYIDEPPTQPVHDPAGVFDFIDDPKQYLDMIRGE